MAESGSARDQRFRVVFDDCYSKVVDYARRRVPDHEVDDIVSATFLVVWRRLDDLPEEKALPWIYGVARRVVSDRYRARGRWQRLLRRFAGTQPASFVDSDWCPDDDVATTLARLRPADTTVLALAYWEELTPTEISQVLGISVNAATIRLHRARKRFEVAWTSRSDDEHRSSSGGRSR